MKKHRIPVLVLALFTLFAFASCDMINEFIASRTRNIAVIQLYNSSGEKTLKLQPNDTLYVEVQGLKPEGFYQVECLDPEGNLITMMTAQADADGTIPPSPLWYDIGFKIVSVDLGDGPVWKATLPADNELGLNAFNVRVVSLSEADRDVAPTTDFQLPFFVVYNTDIERPQPIVMASREVDSQLIVENTFSVGDELWVQVANLEAPPLPIQPTDTVQVFIVPFQPSLYEDGDPIANYVLVQDATCDALAAGVWINVNDVKGNSWNTLPDWAKGNAFSVIVDVDNNNEFNIKKEGTSDFYLDGIDGNGVAGFIVQKPAVPAAVFESANIASGGTTGWYSTHSFGWWPDYDYRDEYRADGTDTRYAWDWYSGSYGYGVKAIWNPYIENGYQQIPGADPIPGLYYGAYVDVYVVHKDDWAGILGGGVLVAAPGSWMKTLPVQYACDNGASQQNIWNAPMVPGDYYVVVDLGRDGYLDEEDIVDNLAQDGTVRNVGGFSIFDPNVVAQ